MGGGPVDADRWPLLSAVAPTALSAIVMGCVINQRVDTRRFFVYLQAGLIVSGAGLVLRAIVTWTAHRPAAR